MLEFARAGASIGANSATLEKTRILGAYFRTLNDDDLRRAAVYMSGRAFAPSKRRTLGLGWSTVSKVVSSLSERGEDELGTIFRKHSDLGDWAGEALDGSTRPEPVTLADVETSLEAIRTARGNAKAKPLESLLKRVHLVTGDIGETAVRCKRGDFEASTITPFQPVRFMLASPVETPVDVFDRMGAGKVWTEEKYDGVRCQLHRQGTRVELFSRDLKETTGAFPELVENAPAIGHDVLFDGEVLAHRDGRVLRFFELQRRLGRKQVAVDLRRDIPVVLVIFDLLWLDGRTLIDEPLTTRRKLLEGLGLAHPYLLARLEEATDPDHLDRIFGETRERGNEGLMVKDPLSPYTPGRRGLAWLKLKRPLATLDVVVTAVEWGHGKRRGVLSDYTFAVNDTSTRRLLNVGKAYTGLTDAEIAEMTKRFLEITIEDHGHVRLVNPEVVLEVAFDSIQHSSRHKSGYALRFPRIVRIRDDKPVDEIDTLDRVTEL